MVSKWVEWLVVGSVEQLVVMSAVEQVEKKDEQSVAGTAFYLAKMWVHMILYYLDSMRERKSDKETEI
jgi:hypothetical protein